MGIKPEDALPGRRIGFSFADGSRKFYDVDADGRVYWLKPAGTGGNRLIRYRVRDAKLAEWIREQAAKQPATEPAE